MLQTLTDKGYELNYISKKTKISLSKLKNYFRNKENLSTKQFEKICNFAELDSRLFKEVKHKEDAVGKLYVSHKQSIKTIRKVLLFSILTLRRSNRAYINT